MIACLTWGYIGVLRINKSYDFVMSVIGASRPACV